MLFKKVLSDEEKAFVREYVAEVVEENERKDRRQEMAQEFGVSIKTIAAITAWTTIRANQVLECNVPASDDYEDVPDATISIKTPSGRGEHFNYNNDVKNAWRNTVREYVVGNTTKQERAKMQALLLPGIECTEAEMFLDMGFTPHNITGVEGGDKDARAIFQKNAEKLGIRYKLGRLENLLPEDKTSYGVVSLDFLGQFCFSYLKILRYLRLDKNSLLMTNMMARRETKEMQQRLQLFTMATDPTQMKPFAHSFYDNGAFAALLGMWKNIKSLQIPGNLKNLRESAIWPEVCMNVGVERCENQAYPDLVAQIQPDMTMGLTDTTARFAAIVETAREALAPLQAEINRVYSSQDHWNNAHQHFYRLLAVGLGQTITVKDHKAYKYESQAGKTKIPYHTDLFKLEQQKQAVTELRHSVKFILQSVLDYMQASDHTVNTRSVKICDRRRQVLGDSQAVASASDMIIEQLHSGQTNEISIGRLVNDMDASLKMYQGTIFADDQRGKLTTHRQIIEPIRSDVTPTKV